MNWLVHEWRLLVRSRLAAAALLLLLCLSALAVLAGLREVQRQRHTIARVQGLQQQELQAEMQKHATKGDAGSAAYYTFHGTWDPPSPAAFLALGLRDAAPYVLRVRALALQAQLHEGESTNPELVLAGRFDFAFVLVYLAPLFLVVLHYDLVSGERSAGRLGALLALPGTGRRLWLRRSGLRVGLVFAALVTPALAGALASGTPAAGLLTLLLATAPYLLFWSGLALGVAALGGSSAAKATALVGAWVVLTLVAPTLSNAALARLLPVHQGVELMLGQREAVHGAWDKPREATMERFFRGHPEWRGTAPLPAGFHWKWYFAFQQLGDESVQAQVAAYRDGLVARQRWTERLGWLLPAVGVQAALHRHANTDLLAELAYQDRIAQFHDRLRRFYYPYLFSETRFGTDAFAKLPRFEPAPVAADLPLPPLLGLAAMALLASWGGIVSLRRIGLLQARPSAAPS
ncbi:DUF3526 domain-containing protein [Eleftheria terrae]|uniref:DUF3526 domain-containing protein n=1 Tax=Eleftheria terrae TaxID=1597781 RepID=UPI00263A4BD4|nr:DUF3526 domain-containing protein [Eleftheria terrae]WKB55428.1 DUF3526 domain-containing protein [Eleftheria terrae]